ncbi:winged helix-turn-helix domain-containing protein [Natrialba sp. PRR66]|uniref:winged helix-turn-helix domain-containing protein n=1 Tax=Natrialba sp. PRR66 TaxID=3098146 RepID=UPI002B1E1C81|nr:winged helix-turn-helix domain-containing protein [Natrialba sp. PRR66]
MTSLENWDHYWNTVSSSRKTERDRLKDGEALGGGTPLAQDTQLGYLRELCEEAGIDDWVGEIDHTITYESNKQKIMDRYGVRGFKEDQKAAAARGKAEQKEHEEQAPDDAPSSLEEQMHQQASGRNQTPNNVGVESIGKSSQRSLSLSQVRRRCLEAVEEAYAENRPVLIDALPGTGKSYAAIEAVSTTETPITILTSRGRKGRYAEIKSWCQKHGLSSKILPRADKECPTFAGKHGSQVEARFKRYRGLGVTVSDLHTYRNPPCQSESRCPYKSAWDFNTENYDVLIGHYTHAYVEKVIENRIVVIDEAPSDAFLTKFEDPQTTITNFLQQTGSIPFPNYHGLISNTDRGKEESALDWFENRGINIGNSKQILDQSTKDYHIHAPLLVLGILVSRDLGNSWSTAALGGGQVFAHNQNANEMYVLTPPTLVNAKNVIALDGAPTPRLYDLMFALDFKHKQVLTDTEREKYIRNTQKLRIVQTEIRSIYPYSSGKHANVDRDEALLREVAGKHNCEPAVITSKRVLPKLKSRNIPISTKSTNYGNIKGSNELADENVGVILGSRHFGDKYVEQWAALFGIAATGSGQGSAKSYGPFGDEVLQHMRENEVLQAIFRFARDDTEATVYVNTAAIPPWLSREIALGVVRTRVDTERDIIDALSDVGTASGADIARKTGYNKNTVRSHLRKLQDEGIVRKTGEKKGTEWHDNGLSDANKCGIVDLSSLTNQTHNISIGDVGDKIEQRLEQYGIDQQERDRLLGDRRMSSWRTN